MTRPYHTSRPAPLTPAERMERKRKVQAQRQAEKEARQEVKQTLKLAGLRYDYGQVEEQHRELVQRAALEIRSRLKRTVEDMIEIGRQLNEVQELLGRRQFYDWAQNEFGMSRGSVFEFVQIATRFGGNPSNFERILPSVVRRLALPSVPDEAVNAVLWASRDKALPFKDAMAIVKPYLPVKPPKQLPPPPQPETIEVEYTVTKLEPKVEPLSFAEWLAACPVDLGLREQLAILTLAKTTALRALGDRPKLYNAVYGALPTWSQMITAIEKELKRE